MLNLKVHLRRPSSSLASQLLRSSPARPQSIRHVSYCVLRRARSLTPALRGVKPHHSVHTTVQAPQFSSLSWQLGSVLTGRVKLRPPQWLTVPGSCNVWILYGSYSYSYSDNRVSAGVSGWGGGGGGGGVV